MTRKNFLKSWMFFFFAMILGCKKSVTEGELNLGGGYVLCVTSGVDVEVIDWNSTNAGEIPPTVTEIGWNEQYIIAKRTNRVITEPELWIIDKKQQQLIGPMLQSSFLDEVQKNPDLRSIKLESVTNFKMK